MGYPDFVYLPLHEAAQRLIASPRSVRRWIKSGRFPGTIRVGVQLRIPYVAVLAFARGRSSPGLRVPFPDKPTLTIPELAARWRVSERTIRRISRRVLPFHEARSGSVVLSGDVRRCETVFRYPEEAEDGPDDPAASIVSGFDLLEDE